MKETRSSETASSAPQSGLRALVGSVFTGDRVLWIIIAALAVISVLVVYSSTAKMAYDAHTARTTAHFLRQQLLLDAKTLCIQIVHLNRMKEQIMAILNDTNPFNKKAKAEELAALLDKYIPGAEAMRTKLRKYDTAYRELTAENAALEKQLGAASGDFAGGKAGGGV